MAKLHFRRVYFQSPVYKGATIFIVAAFKSKHWYYRPIARHLTKAGFNVYIYDYAARPLLRSQPQQWIEFSHAIFRDIQENIAAELAKDANARFGIMGASVGSTIALYVAKLCPQLERIVFVTLYGSSAQLVWENKSLRRVKKQFVRAHQGIQDAIEAYGALEGTTNLDKLGQRPILLFVSMDDRVISYSNANLFIQAAVAQKLNFSYKIVDATRHSFAILRTFANYSAWLPFVAELQRPSKDAQAGRTRGGNRSFRSVATVKRKVYV